jgi:hypothetical protein
MPCCSDGADTGICRCASSTRPAPI